MERPILTLMIDDAESTKLIARVAVLEHSAVITGATDKRSEMLLLADDCLDLCGLLWLGSSLAAAEMGVEVADAATDWGFTVTVDGAPLSPEGSAS